MPCPYAFFEVAEKVATELPASSLTYAQKGELYGLYKVSTVSATPTSARPGFFDQVGRGKWDAWSAAGSNGAKTAVQAMKEYAALVEQLSGKKLEVPPPPPGWTHPIINAAPGDVSAPPPPAPPAQQPSALCPMAASAFSSALKSGGAAASNAVISFLSSDREQGPGADREHAAALFAALSSKEGSAIKTRDEEDGRLLALGISASLASGALQPLSSPRVYERIAVDGQSPAEVAGSVLSRLPALSVGVGVVVVIVGLSGVGKGTTVDVLKAELQARRTPEEKGMVQTWSNGNIFRCLTMLASLYVAERKEKFGETLKVEEILTDSRKQEFMSYLSFARRPTGAFDTRVVGLGVDYWVGDIQNTVLKGPLVSGLIPTVAERTQGEVISFANGAIEKLAVEGGIDVIVEGRAQTLDFVDSQHRFELVLNDDDVVGKRRAAQLVGAAVEKVCEKWENREARAEEVVEETYKQLTILAA